MAYFLGLFNVAYIGRFATYGHSGAPSHVRAMPLAARLNSVQCATGPLADSRWTRCQPSAAAPAPSRPAAVTGFRSSHRPQVGRDAIGLRLGNARRPDSRCSAANGAESSRQQPDDRQPSPLPLSGRYGTRKLGQKPLVAQVAGLFALLLLSVVRCCHGWGLEVLNCAGALSCCRPFCCSSGLGCCLIGSVPGP